MRKEIWALVAILSVIFGTILLLSEWNKRHGLKKRRIMRSRQTDACTLFVHMARAHALPLSQKDCERHVVGLGKSKWKHFVSCMEDNRKDGVALLSCVGNRLCSMDRPEGCLLEGASMLSSGQKKGVNRGVVFLLGRCGSGELASCDHLVTWIQQKEDPGLESVLKQALGFSCKLGRQAACLRLKKDPVLEACALEEIGTCLAGAEKSSDPIVQYLACSLGGSKYCKRMLDKLFFLKLPGKSHGLVLSHADACLLGDFASCAEVAVATGNVGLSTFACRNGGLSACRFLLTGGNLGARRKLYLRQSMCNDGDEEACREVYDSARRFLKRQTSTP
ncbi:hypothetical protein KKF84_11420 [Myxococcota bacterium]|nr:hypothetical protein [Myxococcota bacterium]MBU1535921.1 hypothetical protein [Myxococcota bacterium]